MFKQKRDNSNENVPRRRRRRRRTRPSCPWAAEAEEDGAGQRAVRVLDLLDHVVEEAPARVAVQGIIK